jgi:hypothetical protein
MAQLPALSFNPQNALIDFSPVTNALENNRRNALMQQQNDRADRQMQMQEDEFSYRRGRDQKQDARQEVEWYGKQAMAVDQMPDGPQRQAVWQRIVQKHGADGLTPEEMDHRTGPKIMAAQAGQFFDQRDSRIKDLEIQKTQAQIGLTNAQAAAAAQRGDGSFNQRAQAAGTYGLDPNSDAGRAYILTGKLPREDQQTLTATDKKAILEADENVGTNRAAIQAIGQAKELSPKANSGWGANLRAQIGANLPDMLVPDFVSSPESSQATLDFDNAVVGQALGQLKAIFGGNPTEGERKILLDLQGASGKPEAVRTEILKRANIAAENRLRLNEQRAKELRGGEYYKPGGGSAAANPMSFQSTAGNPLEEAKAAIAKGADPQKVMQRLQQMGVDLRGLQ